MWRLGKLQNFHLASIDELWKTRKIRILKKWEQKKKKKNAGDIIILHMCTKNTITWDAVSEIRSETEFFVILSKTQRTKIWKWTKYQEISSFSTSVPYKWQSYEYGSWDMECNRQNFLSSWAIFCPFTLVTARKMKISKK